MRAVEQERIAQDLCQFALGLCRDLGRGLLAFDEGAATNAHFDQLVVEKGAVDGCEKGGRDALFAHADDSAEIVTFGA